ncbi:immune inhibitor A domain-containing protein [Nocardioides sp. SYSU D00038]|uniref:immune inhibitor A domain-containing protein n=1 Tax=Nocardioides sp. SYSU D00038 TaxID=2812554 RepID=UPI0019676E7B|nr:immune inhibitor A domain-containing protein [Nocardioides sp. SYSU D00038]
MNRRITSVVGVVAALGLAATAVQGTAQAAPDIDDAPTTLSGPQARPDNHPDPLHAKRTALRQRAVDELVAGKARTVGKGPDRAIRLADGTEVDYPVSQTAQLLTFLVEFGDGEGNPAFPDNTSGPLHNEIPEPAESDNSTYWEADFSRQHFLDMFFNGLADQDGESFRDVYKEMSSGRFHLEGDVSDWVKVEHPASYYQTAVDDDEDPATPPIGDETGEAMTAFIQDGADAWFADQKAAGKSDAEIAEYLKTFDVWDRYDFDADGDFNEADGYIDHFQAIHAGEGEDSGAPTWAIWSHRSSVNQNGDVGPEGNKNGGVEIGDTGLWIRDYTTEPENGGLGVFAHEFGHDLGLPDYYDTVDGDNSTGFWNLMSSGSWMGHGEGTTGTTPNHMGATEKLFLGWYGPNDLEIVDGSDAPQNVVLGPSYHANTVGAQAVAVTLPRASAVIDVVEPDGPGTHYFYSGNGDERVATVTSPTVTVPADDPTLTARVSYSIEDDWDYAYLKVSADGGQTWTYTETNLSTTTDPNQQNEGFGITGCSGTRTAGECDNAWTDLTADLTQWAGDEVKVEFEMYNDAAYHELGFSVDTIAIGDTLLTDVEDGAPTWTLDGFRVMDGADYTLVYDHYYVAENRQYRGYDRTLAEGPYSHDYPVTAPNKVDQFPYQDGLLIWYANGRYADNNTSSHPGGGQALPVDANPEYELWHNAAGNPASYASGRLNAYDATFDVDQTDGLHLTTEANGGMSYDVDAHPGTPVFEDTDPEAYWDDTWQISGWYSTQVAGNGTVIQVVDSDEASGRMVLKVGRKFVAATSPASITGTPAVGQTLTAVAPDFWQDDVSTSYQWQVDGKAIWQATGETYVVQPGDAGKKIGVVVTGSKADYLPAKAPASVTVALQGAPVATAPPTITGSARVGQTLTITPATWPVEGTSTFAWSVGGKAVGTGTSYVLKPRDAGKTVTVTETRTAAGYSPGTATSTASAKVLPATATLKVKAPKKVKRGKKPTVKVTVSAPGLVPTGAVKVTYAGKSVGTRTLAGGKVSLQLPKKQGKGTKKLVVRYLPSTGFTGATVTVKIKVT